MNKYHKILTEDLEKILIENPEARKTANRCRTIRMSILKAYPSSLTDIGRETMLNIIKDIVYLDRKLRRLTEGEEKQLKNDLEKKFIKDELYGEPQTN